MDYQAASFLLRPRSQELGITTLTTPQISTTPLLDLFFASFCFASISASRVSEIGIGPRSSPACRPPPTFTCSTLYHFLCRHSYDERRCKTKSIYIPFYCLRGGVARIAYIEFIVTSISWPGVGFHCMEHMADATHTCVRLRSNWMDFPLNFTDGFMTRLCSALAIG